MLKVGNIAAIMLSDCLIPQAFQDFQAFSGKNVGLIYNVKGPKSHYLAEFIT